MARINVKERTPILTHEGAKAVALSPLSQLRRTVNACLLWEKQFYEDGESMAERIQALVPQCTVDEVAEVAVKARMEHHLRHVPLLLLRELTTHPQLSRTNSSAIALALSSCCLRPDDVTEFIALFLAAGGKKGLTRQVKKGLASAFRRFDAYQLAKYDRAGDKIRLRDALFLIHAKPRDAEQDALWKQLIAGELPVPDTWEVGLSAARTAVEKKAVWERLLARRQLGGLALLRNLRNMHAVDVQRAVIADAMKVNAFRRVLPFRFAAAAKKAPWYEEIIEEAMLRNLQQQPKLPGKTVVVVDVSGSMYGTPVSEQSDMDRATAACTLAVMLRELCEDVSIYATAGNDFKRYHKTRIVPNRRGFALGDAIFQLCRPLEGGGIFLTQCMEYVKKAEGAADRIVVITDEQDCEKDTEKSPLKAEAFGARNYLINVASYRPGVGYGRWTHIDGFSESVVRYICAQEMQHA